MFYHRTFWEYIVFLFPVHVPLRNSRVWVSESKHEISVNANGRCYLTNIFGFPASCQRRSQAESKKGKAIPVTGSGGPYGCETSRLPHLLDNRLTDVSEVVSLTRRPPFTFQEDSWYSFLPESESTPGP
jgi:hypothetical protein